ncbi:hypothetical protein L6164_017557 [Bauhinia variegata]|uniref:Uncharacterized protein n=1 Tax=Bauhinia variegata TaxID=167791 RepID=A0ACB9N850_BAUVA|nr:hypothetical protein L6164_017557 [Bauhinia variegata]
MSRFRLFELIEEPFYFSPPTLFRETSIVAPKSQTFSSFVDDDLDVGFALDLFHPPTALEVFDTVTDLVRIDRAPSLRYRRVERVEKLRTELYLQTLGDRVAELESRFDRLVGASRVSAGDRKYTWTAQIKTPEKDGFDRKYKWVADIGKEKKGAVARNYKWTAEIKGKGEESGASRTYTIKVESGSEKESEKEKEKKEKKKGSEFRIVEIDEPNEHGAVVLRQAFAKRFGAVQRGKGKKKELSPQDAAILIQINFRAYLIRRSKSLRALRELAVAKSKLKEIRAQFNNFAYRRRVARDAGERQRFSEKIIVLLLTVDAIEGADLLVRSAKRSMVDELEAMLDVVDPQPAGRSLSIKRRTFDMPDGIIRKEIAEGVSQVVQLIDQAERSNGTFEACS